MAFHTDAMAAALQTLVSALQSVMPKMKPPRCPVWMSATGEELSPEKWDAGWCCELLRRQLVGTIQWESVLQGMIKGGVQEFFELGPKEEIKNTLKRVDEN